MDANSRKTYFSALLAVVFALTMWFFFTEGLTVATLVSVPVILGAEAIVLSMMYFTIFHGAVEKHVVAQSATERAIRLPETHRHLNRAS